MFNAISNEQDLRNLLTTKDFLRLFRIYLLIKPNKDLTNVQSKPIQSILKLIF